jgi:WD40 repeat protein
MKRPVSGVSFGADSLQLVAGGSGGYDVWDWAASKGTFRPSHNTADLFGLRCDPLGRWIYVSDYRGGFRILPLDEQNAPLAPGSPHERHVRSFDLSPDGTRLILSRGGAGTNRVECWKILPSRGIAPAWSLRDGKLIDPHEPYLLNQATWTANGVAIGPRGKTVAVAETRVGGTSSEKPYIVVRDGRTGKAIAELGRSETSFDARLVLAVDGRAVYAWDKRLLERWDLKAGKRTVQVPSAGRAYFEAVAAHPSGRLVMTVSGDGKARYLDPVDLSQQKELHCKIGKLHSLAISPDGAVAAAGGDKGQVALWNLDE